MKLQILIQLLLLLCMTGPVFAEDTCTVRYSFTDIENQEVCMHLEKDEVCLAEAADNNIKESDMSGVEFTLMETNHLPVILEKRNINKTLILLPGVKAIKQ